MVLLRLFLSVIIFWLLVIMFCSFFGVIFLCFVVFSVLLWFSMVKWFFIVSVWCMLWVIKIMLMFCLCILLMVVRILVVWWMLRVEVGLFKIRIFVLKCIVWVIVMVWCLLFDKVLIVWLGLCRLMFILCIFFMVMWLVYLWLKNFIGLCFLIGLLFMKKFWLIDIRGIIVRCWCIVVMFVEIVFFGFVKCIGVFLKVILFLVGWCMLDMVLMKVDLFVLLFFRR